MTLVDIQPLHTAVGEMEDIWQLEDISPGNSLVFLGTSMAFHAIEEAESNQCLSLQCRVFQEVLVFGGSCTVAVGFAPVCGNDGIP